MAKKKKPESLLENIKVFVSTYVLALLIRTFLIEASQIPSQSMVPNLLVGDTLMVEKISLGTYIPVLNKKLPNFTNPKANDMVVFVSPEWKAPSFGDQLITFLSLSLINKDNTFNNPKILVKRIVAAPGDEVTMTNGQLYINQENLNQGYLKNESQPLFSGGKRYGSITMNLFQEKNRDYQRLIQYLPKKMSRAEVDMTLFEYPDFVNEIRELVVLGFPKIRIPQKGQKILLTEASLYERYLLTMLIQRESRKITTFTNGKIYQNNIEISEWIPKDDYYFMMGDNRDFSEDGRYFGFVPRNNIYGRILFRYWPLNRVAFDLNIKK
ncbi:MAG: signal peptidase I [Brevinema sp.]